MTGRPPCCPGSNLTSRSKIQNSTSRSTAWFYSSRIRIRRTAPSIMTRSILHRDGRASRICPYFTSSGSGSGTSTRSIKRGTGSGCSTFPAKPAFHDRLADLFRAKCPLALEPHGPARRGGLHSGVVRELVRQDLFPEAGGLHHPAPGDRDPARRGAVFQRRAYLFRRSLRQNLFPGAEVGIFNNGFSHAHPDGHLLYTASRPLSADLRDRFRRGFCLRPVPAPPDRPILTPDRNVDSIRHFQLKRKRLRGKIPGAAVLPDMGHTKTVPRP
jgi:hypothetical protein